jgi:hypothetical protein
MNFVSPRTGPSLKRIQELKSSHQKKNTGERRIFLKKNGFLRQALLLTWARRPEILGHISLPGAAADVPHLGFPPSQSSISVSSLSLQGEGKGKEEDGGGRSVAEQRGMAKSRWGI